MAVCTLPQDAGLKLNLQKSPGTDYFSGAIFYLGLRKKERFAHREWDEALLSL